MQICISNEFLTSADVAGQDQACMFFRQHQGSDTSGGRQGCQWGFVDCAGMESRLLCHAEKP